MKFAFGCLTTTVKESEFEISDAYRVIPGKNPGIRNKNKKRM
jgi:hypothetical protein